MPKLAFPSSRHRIRTARNPCLNRALTLCLAITGAYSIFSVSGPSVHAQVPAGFATTPVFSDDFSGTALDRSKWSFRDLGQRNNCVNTESAVRVAEGHLTITTYSDNVPSAQTIQNFCSMISTANSFSLKYGYWETSVRFHRAPGVQAAFWIQSATIGKFIGKPDISGVEIDVFEHLAEVGPKEYDHAIHWDGYEAHHLQVASKRTLSNLDDGNFHVFAVAWQPTGYTFYVDHQVTYELSAQEAPVSNVPEYVILSTEVPRAFPAAGYGDLAHSSSTFDVDYVRVYPYQPASKSSKGD